AALKSQENLKNEEYIAPPEEVQKNLLFLWGRISANAEMSRKVVKSSRFEGAARQEIRIALMRLIAKWKAVLSTLDAPRRDDEKTARRMPRRIEEISREKDADNKSVSANVYIRKFLNFMVDYSNEFEQWLPNAKLSADDKEELIDALQRWAE